MIKYEQAFSDWEYLWDIAPACDMTGAYVDQGDLDDLLRKPMKATARDCLSKQIEYWFSAGPDNYDGKIPASTFDELVEMYPDIIEIMERHFISSAEFIYSNMEGG